MPRKIAYLTIDDSPTKDFSQKLDYLIAKNVPAIWFCIGANLVEFPEKAIDAMQKGYIIGNHSYTHPHFSDIPLEVAYDEIQRTDALINDLYAQAKVERPAHYFRFPYGDKGGLQGSDVYEGYTAEGQKRKDAIQAFLRDLGYVQPTFAGVTYTHYREHGLLDDVDWYWTYDCMEWTVFKPEPVHGIDSLEKVFARMDEDVPEGNRGLNDARSEEIILLHDHDYTSTFFEPIIDRLLAKGIEFQPIPIV